ncbi:MAG: Asd/ArgC dimerization domain-containing protein [Thermoanaerobaculia bacterium]
MPDPKHPSGFRIGIVNSMTLVGNEIKSILQERAFPFEKVVLLDSIGSEVGALTEVGDSPAVVVAVSDDELEDCDLVLFCGPAAKNAEWIQRMAEDRFVAIDLSQPSSAEDGKLAVAGVNLEEVDAADEILISPHPIAIPLALILHQLQSLGRIESCTATVVQPASHFDQAGIDELVQQTIGVLNLQNVPKEVFDRQLAFNLYPAPERHEVDVISQIKALTNPDCEIALSITQGTLFHGHTFSLFLRMETSVKVEALRTRLAGNPAITVADPDDSYGTVDAAGKDEVLIVEIRQDPSIAGGFWVWAVCDNLRRGAALNAVLIAEKVLFGSALLN